MRYNLQSLSRLILVSYFSYAPYNGNILLCKILNVYIIEGTMQNNFENVVLQNSCVGKKDKYCINSVSSYRRIIQENEIACFHVILSKIYLFLKSKFFFVLLFFLYF